MIGGGGKGSMPSRPKKLCVGRVSKNALAKAMGEDPTMTIRNAWLETRPDNENNLN